MFFNKTLRRWERHPDCQCQHDPCYCRWLRPLDEHGKPIPFPIFDALRAWERQGPKESA